MAFCSNCGKEIDDETDFCPNCGTRVIKTEKQTEVKVQTTPEENTTGFAVIGFLFPMVGLILWAVWKKSNPKRSKSTIKGTLIGFAVGIVLSILLAVIGGE